MGHMIKTYRDLDGPVGTGMDAPVKGNLDFNGPTPFPGGEMVMVNMTEMGGNPLPVPGGVLPIPAALSFDEAAGRLHFKLMQAEKVLTGNEPSLPSDLAEEPGWDLVIL